MDYASLTEMVYYAQQAALKAKEAAMKEPLNIKYDISFLVDIALDNKDQDLFNWCMEVNK
jgi:hypothetical protein